MILAVRRLTSPLLWIAAGLILPVVGLSDAESQRSPLWFAEFPLFALMILLLVRGGLRLRPSPGQAFAAVAALSWGFGMVYELSLTVDGTGIGGIHPSTGPSFVLAQGDYVPLALATALIVRRWGLGFREMYLVAAGLSLTEGLIFTGVLTQIILSPQAVWAPVFLAYYALAYAAFIAMPVLIVSPAALAVRPPVRVPGAPWLVLGGFVLGIAVRLFWGLAYIPLVEALVPAAAPV